MSIAMNSAAKEFNESARISIRGPTDPFDTFHPQNAASAFRTSGLFIGINRFENGWPPSTPAHSLGAALALDAFYNAIPAQSSSVRDNTASRLGSHLTLLTELRMRPEDKERFFPGLVDVLRSIRHPFPVFEYVPNGRTPPLEPFVPLAEEIRRGKRPPLFYSNKVHQDGTFRYFGKSTTINRSVLLSSIDAHVTDAATQIAQIRTTVPTGDDDDPPAEKLSDQLKQPHKLPLLITLYVATHGVLWTDGEQYLLPADAKENEPDTWIAVKSVVDRYKRLADPTLNGKVGFLLIFDACNFPLESGIKRTANGVAAFSGSAIVLAASPGEPAFHWNNRGETEFQVEKETDSGIFGRQRATDERYRVSFESRMSALPVAMLSTLAQKEKEAAAVVDGYVRAGLGPSTGVVTASFGVDAWLESMQEPLNQILARQKPRSVQTILVSSKLSEAFKFSVMFDLDQQEKAAKK